MTLGLHVHELASSPQGTIHSLDLYAPHVMALSP